MTKQELQSKARYFEEKAEECMKLLGALDPMTQEFCRRYHEVMAQIRLIERT